MIALADEDDAELAVMQRRFHYAYLNTSSIACGMAAINERRVRAITYQELLCALQAREKSRG